ncbi:hypothetical protein [Solidesulfovibrio alcoholivorans]|uniref:hypothetical protein n=1 Tax=Solidesulfovibrio alcoholivorans TaxID=81406 RepID=UPI000496C5D0|nr:hypothetical protein [Solidesulfovibrio alcoholivorans]
MAPIAAVTAASAYQRESSRLAPCAPQVGGKRITRDATLSFGPFSVSYSATDYEFDLSGASAQSSFADALDAAAATALLQDSGNAAQRTDDAASSPLRRRQALAGYQAAAATATQRMGASMFCAVA